MDSVHRHPLASSVLSVPGERVGSCGERIAAVHLTEDDGCEIVARNWRVALDELRGELDLVALDHRAATVVIGEVKTRRDAARFGGAREALGTRQRGRIRALAAVFLREAGLPYPRVRFDLLAVDLGRAPTLTHVMDAW